MTGFDFFRQNGMGDRGGGKGTVTLTAFGVCRRGGAIGFDREFYAKRILILATEVMDGADAAQVAQVCQRVLQKRRWMCWS